MSQALAGRVRYNRPAAPLDARAAAVVLAGLAAGAGLAMCERRLRPTPARNTSATSETAGRRLSAAAALLSASVLTDSATEHFRGGFRNRAMFAPLVGSSLSLAAGVDGAARAGGRRVRRLREEAYNTAGLVGAVGLAFHLYNVLKRPGRLDWLNLFYAAPLGAPAALVLAGVIGRSAEAVRHQPRADRRWGRALSGLTSFGLMGTVGEVLLMHFRGAFQNPFMWLPVSLPPVAAALTAQAAVGQSPRWRLFTRGWLWLTMALGLGGVGFHAYGVSRRMGGWRNWSQNLLAGPPLPAPPAFSALALAGLAALDLIEASGR